MNNRRLAKKHIALNYCEISEKDFFPPEDERAYHSNVYDIEGGDNFEDYFRWFYSNYEKDIFD